MLLYIIFWKQGKTLSPVALFRLHPPTVNIYRGTIASSNPFITVHDDTKFFFSYLPVRLIYVVEPQGKLFFRAKENIIPLLETAVLDFLNSNSRSLKMANIIKAKLILERRQANNSIQDIANDIMLQRNQKSYSD